MKFALIILTLNGGWRLKQLMASVAAQAVHPDEKVIIDSQSTDDTVNTANSFGFTVITIPRRQFSHGGTRQLAVEFVSERFPDIEAIAFMTQDAVLADEFALQQLLRSLKEPRTGAAYGRQLPYLDSGLLGAHARIFNYPDGNCIKTMADVPKLGIKTAFISNSFAVYRLTALREIGGFPKDVILSEDMYAAGKMLKRDWQVAYCADSKAYHSHDYTLLEEFRRYFDIGVFHSRETWLLQTFGKAEGEGIRFLVSEMEFLWSKNARLAMIQSFVRAGVKFAGYRLGLAQKIIPRRLKTFFSMNKAYWLNE